VPPGQAETLEQGPARRPPSRRRRAGVLVLVGVLVAVAASGAALDRRARQREAVRVAGCVDAVTSAVSYANTRVDAISTYVRPALDAAATPRARDRLLGTVRSAVAPTVPDVRRAGHLCRGVRVPWFHDALEATRRDCVDLAGRDLEYLREVVAYGNRAYAARSIPAGRCTAP
jgi:hypothetical protein